VTSERSYSASVRSVILSSDGIRCGALAEGSKTLMALPFQ
jgi:hypothetical protein